VGRGSLPQEEWLNRVDVFAINDTGGIVSGDDNGCIWFEYYTFATNGALLKDPCSHLGDFVSGEMGEERRVQGPPSLIRLPTERRALTTEEAWGAVAALLRTLVELRPSAHQIAGEQVLRQLVELESRSKDMAKRLRLPELALLRTIDSEVYEAMFEVFAKHLGSVRKQLAGKKKDQWLFRFMEPCVACFELLFGQTATPGSAEKPSGFTDFAVTFLKEIGGVQCAPTSIRAALTKWRKQHHCGALKRKRLRSALP
jgi:hypothetical protein